MAPALLLGDSNEYFGRGGNRLRYCNMKCSVMSGSGQKAKTSLRAYVFRFALDSDIRRPGGPLPDL